MRLESSISQRPKRIHSSSKASSQSAVVQRSEDHDSTSLYGARYVSYKHSEDVASNEQNSGSLYNSRYTSKKPSKWTRATPALQEETSHNEGPVEHPAQKAWNSKLIPTSDQALKQSLEGRKTTLPIGQTREQNFGSLIKSDRHPRQSRTQRSFHFRNDTVGNGSSSDHKTSNYQGPSTYKAAEKSNFATHGALQYKQGHFRKVLFQGDSLPNHRDEFRGGPRIRNTLSGAGHIAHRNINPSEVLEDSVADHNSRWSNDAPMWSNLVRKSETSKNDDHSQTSNNEVVRFRPLGRGTVREEVVRSRHLASGIPQKESPDPTKSESADQSSRSLWRSVSFEDSEDKSQKLSTGYIGFRTDNQTIEGSPEKQLRTEPARRREFTIPDAPKIKPDFVTRIREGRRFTSWDEVPEEKMNSPRAQQRKPRVKQQKDEDEDLDPEKLERIEARQHRKAIQKVSREDRASGQVFVVPSFISIGNLASSLKIRAAAFSEVLRNQGFSELNNDHVLDAETAGLIANELGFKAVLPAKLSETDLVAKSPPTDTDLLPPRPPIVTIMGHVDHGKTTLLDWLRKSSIAASEHGGITQHIGAFTVQMPSGRIITFLDTPGHAAFLEMRARGANVTDIVILVVAADDSVKPQTIEAIKHAKAARTQIVVAISKVDKPDADPERVKQDLARNGIEVEDYGGDTQTVCVSGKTGEGMDQLEDAVIALADILDVKADTTGDVEGWVLEATQKASGKIATVLVRRGTLKPGQIIVAGHTWARVRNLRDEAGLNIEEALPGAPVEVDGWNEQPKAGAEVLQAPNEQRARRVVDFRVGRAQIEQQATDVTATNEARRLHDEKRTREKARARAIRRGEEVVEEVEEINGPRLTEVPIIIRADVSGSIEAVNASVLALGNSEVRATIIRTAVGNVTISDVEYAAAVGGHIVNFNLPIDGEILRQAEQSGVDIIDGNIIYRITDDVKTVLEKELPPVVTSHVTGEADILQMFEIGLKGKTSLPVAGCKIRNGTITKGSKIRILRKDQVVYDGG